MRGKGLKRLIFTFINYPVGLCKLLLISELINFFIEIVLEFFFFWFSCSGLRPRNSRG
jgi:hypothetical protein